MMFGRRKSPAAQLSEEDEEPRQEFTNYAEFFLVCVGYAVGIGNLIVYPGRVFENGGGSFILAYWISLFVIGIPLFQLELMLGQYFRQSAFHTFKALHKRLWGVGLGHVLMAFFLIIYFNVVIAWSMVYFVYSFKSPLPWKEDSVSFFYDTVLQSSSYIGDVNGMNWKMFGANALAWIIVCLVLIKGVASSGKAAYFTATAPFLCIILLLARGLTLPGYMEGIRAYLHVDVSKLANFQTWARAANQVFYSLGVSMGAVVTFGSYQQKKNSNYIRDGIMFPLINCLTSLIGGFAIYAMLGYIAFKRREENPEVNVQVGDLELSGFSLAFIAYTEGLAMLPGAAAQAFSVIFFIMIFCLGIDTQIGLVEAVITFFKDVVKDADLNISPITVTILTCFLCFVLGIPCVTDAGFYWVTFLWDYGNFVSLFVIAGMSLLGVTWMAGRDWINKASLKVHQKAVNPFLLFFWRFVDPVVYVILLGVSIASLIPYPTTLGFHGEGTGYFPLWAQVLSGLLNYFPVLVIVFALCFPPKWLPFLREDVKSLELSARNAV